MERNVKGLVYGLSAQLWWGLAPLFWHLLKNVNAFEILLHRIFWSFILCAAIITFTGKWKDIFAVFKNKKDLMLLICSSVLINANWGTYIYAVNSGKALESSLAYYICSVLTVLAGAVFFREKINKLKLAAIAFAFASIFVLTFYIKSLPVVTVIISISFLFYGVAKKLVSVNNPVYIITIETMLSAPFAAAVFFIMKSHGLTAFGEDTSTDVLLMLSGPVTAVPLFLYNAAAKHISLSTFGFFQYINPSIVFLIGVFVFGEPFDKIRFISFLLVWIAIIIYSLSFRKKSSNTASQ